MNTTTPKHTHDCDACHFLASMGGRDHYACREAGGELELIIRKSSEPSDYSSLGASMLGLVFSASSETASLVGKYALTAELAAVAGILTKEDTCEDYTNWLGPNGGDRAISPIPEPPTTQPSRTHDTH